MWCYGEPGSIRYNIVIIFMALVNIGLNLAYLQSKYKFSKYIIPAIFGILLSIHLVFVVNTATKVSPFECFKKFDSYYPSLVKATDELSKTYHVKYGVGDYWDSGYITALSKTGVRVNCVFENMRPYIYYCNFKNYFWTDYTHSKRVIYNFISLRNFKDTTAAWILFDHKKIKKVTIDGYSFYLVPDFTINEQTEDIEIIDNLRVKN